MFLLWGLWHGLFLVLERLAGVFQPLGKNFPTIGKNPGFFQPLERSFPTIGKKFSNHWKTLLLRFYTLAVVFAGWILFRSESLSEVWRMLQSLAGCGTVARQARTLWMAFPPKILLALAIGTLFSFPLAPWLLHHLRRTSARLRAPALGELAEWLWITLLGMTALLVLAGGSYNPFIYFRF